MRCVEPLPPQWPTPRDPTIGQTRRRVPLDAQLPETQTPRSPDQPTSAPFASRAPWSGSASSTHADIPLPSISAQWIGGRELTHSSVLASTNSALDIHRVRPDKGARTATGRPSTVITTCSPASTRLSSPRVSLRSSREATSPMRQLEHRCYAHRGPGYAEGAPHRPDRVLEGDNLPLAGGGLWYASGRHSTQAAG